MRAQRSFETHNATTYLAHLKLDLWAITNQDALRVSSDVVLNLGGVVDDKGHGGGVRKQQARDLALHNHPVVHVVADAGRTHVELVAYMLKQSTTLTARRALHQVKADFANLSVACEIGRSELPQMTRSYLYEWLAGCL